MLIRHSDCGESLNSLMNRFLLFIGLHYDAITLASSIGANEASDQRRFQVQSPLTDEVIAAVARLVSRYHDMRLFTDTANFTLRCSTCQIGLKGEKEAVAHAQSTGHSNFTEY